jgi:hypothetical protein
VEVSAQRVAIAGLGLAVIASAIWLFSLDSQLTFIADDWELLVKRHGWGLEYFLDPYHENIVVGPAILYRLLLTVFGMGTRCPSTASRSGSS